MELGRLLVQLRKEKGIYQRELARLLGVSIGTISNYEHGVHNPDPETLNKLADYFGVSTDYLLNRTQYRYNLDNINTQIHSDYTIGDFMNTVLELDNRSRYLLADYIELLTLRKNSLADNSHSIQTDNDIVEE